MFRKTLLATSALVVASSMAVAGQHNVLPKGQTKQMIQNAIHNYLVNKGMIVNRNNVPVAIKLPMSAMKNGAVGHGVNPPALKPRAYNTFSKSKNALFLSYFGWFAGNVASSFGSSYSYCISYNSTYTQCYNYEHIKYSDNLKLNQSAAQPFHGPSHASAISFGTAVYGTGTPTIRASIANGTTTCANSTTSSCPGTSVAGGSTTVSNSFNGLCCTGLKTVTFTNVALKKKGKYWVVLSGASSSTGGRVVWNGQDSNFTAAPTGEGYKYTETAKYHESYRTSKSGHSGTYHSTGNYSSGGWIHTSSFSFGEQQAAFSVN